MLETLRFSQRSLFLYIGIVECIIIYTTEEQHSLINMKIFRNTALIAIFAEG